MDEQLELALEIQHNVVGLDGKPYVPPAGEVADTAFVDTDVINVLTELLRQAKEGVITGLAGIAILADDGFNSFLLESSANVNELLGAMTLLQRLITDKILIMSAEADEDDTEE